MRMNRFAALLAVALMAVVVGAVGYQIGISHGLALGGQAAAANGVPPYGWPPPYGWYRPWGFGFGFLFPLFFFGNAQTDRHIDDLEDYIARNEAVDERRADSPQLRDNTVVLTAQVLGSQSAGEQGADNSADAVNTERIERIVVPQGLFH